MRKISSVNRGLVDASSVYCCTLTYPKRFPTPREAKHDLENILRRFRRAFGPVALVWKLEPQKRGAPHFHLMIFASSVEQLQLQREWWPVAWHDVAGQGDNLHLLWHQGELRNRHCCEAIRSWQGVTSYASKYLGKVVAVDPAAAEQWEFPGRYWGTRDFELLPVQLDTFAASMQAADGIARTVTRYLRHQPTGRFVARDRFSGKKFRFGLAQLKLFDPRYFDIWPVKRRIRRRFNCGISGFVPDQLMKRLLVHWRGHVLLE